MNTMRIARIVFLLTGGCLLLGACLSKRSTDAFVSQAIKAEGVVLDLVRKKSTDSTYAPVVKFMTTAGEPIEFISSLSSYPPDYKRGQKVEVLYRANDPQMAAIGDAKSLWFGWKVLTTLGAFCSLTGAALWAYGARKTRLLAHLKRNGTPVQADVMSVERNTMYSYNDQHPFVIAAQWQDPATKTVHVFKSENIWFDPAAHVEGKKIEVIVDQNNPKRYHMDLTSLPKADV
jgi:Protein of unknown function (DUF3592)